jgi:predicted lipid-binding transport protein (Tim44 family)
LSSPVGDPVIHLGYHEDIKVARVPHAPLAGPHKHLYRGQHSFLYNWNIMEILFDPINFLLLIGAITVLWWLRSVLGQRTGLERPSNPIEIISPKAKTAPTQNRAEVVSIQNWDRYAQPGTDLYEGLTALKKIKPDFNIEHFLDGAKSAHEMILVAFAQSDKKTLKPLLSRAVYDSFEKIIDENKVAENTNIFKFVGINSAKLNSVEIENQNLSMGIIFESQIISATLNAKKEVVSGDERTVSVLKEVWTFERDLNSKDPNWTLVATEDPSSCVN